MKKTLIVIAVALIAYALYQHFIGAKEIPALSANTTDGLAKVTKLAEQQKGSGAAVKVDAATPKPLLASGLISAAAEGAEVFIISPASGSTVSSPVTVQFGIKNMHVAKAGDKTEFSGHHHLLIDLEELPDMTVPLPATDQIVHFGGAQTQATVELEPGKHSLRLLLGNYAHIPHDKPVLSEEITIIVE
jgi:hypothetical protein